MSQDSADDLGSMLGVLLRAHRDRMATLLSELPHGARGYQTLREVSRDRHGSQLALAQHLGIDRTVMTYLVDDLVAAGLVERRENPRDRRQRRVVVTAAGEAALAALCEDVAEAEEQTLGGLTDDERVQLRTLLRRAATASGLDAEDDPCRVIGDLERSVEEPLLPRMSTRS